MAEYTTPTPCDLADITAASDCGESLAGLPTRLYVGFKDDLTARPRLKRPTGEAGDFAFGDYSYIEETPGFEFKDGKHFFMWDIRTDSGQITSSLIAQKKGYTQSLTLGFEIMTPFISSLMRMLGNRKDVFFLIPEGDEYIAFYDPDRDFVIDSGGIAYDSGTTADSESGTTVTMSLNTLPPKTYYKGTVKTTATP